MQVAALVDTGVQASQRAHALIDGEAITPRMSFWISTPFSQEPRLVLTCWRAWEVQVPNYDAPTWHLVGYLAKEQCAKVSSAIAFVHADTAEVTTKTGRTYDISAPSGVDANAAHLWQSWQREHRVVVLREVTTDVLDGRQPVAVKLLRLPG